MILDYPYFKVEIKNTKFSSDAGVVFPKTAIISFLLANQTVSSVEQYGYIETEEIYRMINNNQPSEE